MLVCAVWDVLELGTSARSGDNVLTLVGRLDYLLFYKDFTKEEHFKFQDVLAYTWSVAPIKAESVTDEFIEELFNRQFECEKTGHPGFDDRKLSKFRFVIADIEAQRKIAAQSEAEADANVQE